MLKVAKRRSVLISWFLWHYKDALLEIVQRWGDVLRFILEHFSIIFLLKTFFAPWKRELLSYGRGFNISRYAEVLILNIFSRILGIIARMVLIICGIFTEIIVVIAGILVVLFWMVMPLIIIIGLFVSITWLIGLI